MRRFPLLALVLGVLLVPGGYGLAISARDDHLADQRRQLAAAADSRAAELANLKVAAVSAIRLTAHQAVFERIVAAPEGPRARLARAPRERHDVVRALQLLVTGYGGLVARASLFDDDGGELLRVVGDGASPRVVRPGAGRDGARFLDQTLSLPLGAVHQTTPYRSPVAGRTVVGFATRVSVAGGRGGIVAFEVPLSDVVARLRPAASRAEVLVVDRRTGVSLGGGPTAAGPLRRLLAGGATRGQGAVGGRAVAFHTVAHELGDDNRIAIVAVSDEPAPTILGAALGVPLGAAALGLLLVAGSLSGLLRERRELRRAADTDALTGLGNRRALLADLEGRLRHGRRCALVLLDLDGFKNYNDSFGHLAGDALLERLGRALAAAVAPHARAYRLGGDEFCVLGDAGDLEPLVAAATDALCAEERDALVTATAGAVRLPDEAATAAEALRIADGRMYAGKPGSRIGAGAQSRDVLVALMEHRLGALRLPDAVVDDACALGDRLGLSADELRAVRLAAALHDVGKLAVPRALLERPGPLSRAELAVVRGHHAVGEHLASAAPALRPAARLVRAAGERFDGSGGPDGLAGAAIPLGARVIAVCAAFHAMRSPRPHRPPLDREAALRALRADAGTRFDPVVVDAFCALQAERDGAYGVASQRSMSSTTVSPTASMLAADSLS